MLAYARGRGSFRRSACRRDADDQAAMQFSSSIRKASACQFLISALRRGNRGCCASQSPARRRQASSTGWLSDSSAGSAARKVDSRRGSARDRCRNNCSRSRRQATACEQPRDAPAPPRAPLKRRAMSGSKRPSGSPPTAGSQRRARASRATSTPVSSAIRGTPDDCIYAITCIHAPQTAAASPECGLSLILPSRRPGVNLARPRSGLWSSRRRRPCAPRRVPPWSASSFAAGMSPQGLALPRAPLPV